VSNNGRGPTEVEASDEDDDALETVVDSSGWFSVELRYAYVIASRNEPYLIEDRVVLVDGEDEETALGRGFEIAAEYEDDFETDEGEAGTIHFEGIVAIKELDDVPAAGTEVWHEFMSPDPAASGNDGDELPAVRPTEMAFPRGRDD
jgi:hypothetical protein